MKFYFSFCLLFILKTSWCQQPVLKWANAFLAHNNANYIDYSNGRSVTVDKNGNVYSAGLFNHTLDFDGGPGVYALASLGQDFKETSIYITKQDSNGGLIWAKQIPLFNDGESIVMKLDTTGNLYITCDINDTADMDPGAGVHTLMPKGRTDVFVAKIDPNGDLIWVKQFGGKSSTDIAIACTLDVDLNGNVVVCGYFWGTVDFDPGAGNYDITGWGNGDAFIVKLNSNGDFRWADRFGDKNYSSSHVTISDVKCDKSGNIYTTGGFQGNCDFDPGANFFGLLSGGTFDAFISKLDSSGNFVWAKKIGNSLNNYFLWSKAIDVDSKNNVYTTGSFVGSQDFDPSTTVYNLTSSLHYSSYLLKLNEMGDFKWVKAIGGSNDVANSDLIVDNNDFVYTIGSFSGTADFDPGPGIYTLNTLYSASTVSKFNSSGIFIYTSVFPAKGHYDFSLFNNIDIDKLENIYITGSIIGTNDLDPAPVTYYLTGTSDESPFVLKLSRCSNRTSSILNINTCNSYTLNGVVFDTSGTYTQIISNSTGCDSLITLNLLINKKYSDINREICEGDNFLIHGVYQTKEGTYRDTLSSSTGCDSVIVVHLKVNPKPLLNLGVDRDICEYTQLLVSPGNFVKYLWQNGSVADTFVITTPGLYWVKVTNALNCSSIDTLLINKINKIPTNFLKQNDSICELGKLLITPFVNYKKYLWSDGDTSKTIITNHLGQYWLKVTDDNGCEGIDTINVFSKKCLSGVFIPSAFTPNNDGKNDFFRAIVSGPLMSFKLQVYDRFGQIVFQTNNSNDKWDGRNNGVLYSTSAFVWQCFYQFENKEPEYQKGTVLLIH